MKVEIDILNYNGAYLLEGCLPSILTAATASRHECKLVVVDNVSTDGSEKLVKDKFPQFFFYRAEKNLVLCSLNEAARRSDAEVMIFLNNDLRVDKNFIDPLIDIFLKKEKVFLTAGKMYNFEGTEVEGGTTKLITKWGIIKGVLKYKGYEKELDKGSYTLQSGFGAFDRKKFLELDGYDSFYLPGILEDTDICFRSWLRGYYSYYEPASCLYHMGKASFRKHFGDKKTLAISHRNTYFFIWKNITDKRILAANVFFTLPRMFYALVTLKWDIIWGFAWFLTRLPDVIRRRSQESRNRKYNTRTEREVLEILK
jgi:GT2 family glycosyltransferase